MIGSGQRWAISLAELLMLLLGFFIILDADRATRAAQVGSVAIALTGRTEAPLVLNAETLFVPGEAMLRPDGDATVRKVGGATEIRVAVARADDRRFDRWDLAAARGAAVARALLVDGRPAPRVLLDPAATPGSVTISRAR